MAETKLNYAVEYSQALANAYPNVLHFGALYATENNNKYRFVNADTVEIPSLETSGRVDADRDAIATAKRRYNNSWEPKKLTFFRKWSTLVHPRDVIETNMVATIVNITQTFNETQKFPEIDSYTASKLHTDYVAASGVDDTTVLTKDNVLEVFDKFMQNMDEALVPSTGRIVYCTYAVKTLLKNAAGITRTWNTQTSADGLNRTVDMIDGVEIVGVPSKLMKTAYDFTEGCKVAESAKQINMIALHPTSILTPEVYSFAKLDEPSAGSEGKYVYYEESYSDVFVLNNRIGALQFNVEA